jgi:hypothetical protein
MVNAQTHPSRPSDRRIRPELIRKAGVHGLFDIDAGKPFVEPVAKGPALLVVVGVAKHGRDQQLPLAEIVDRNPPVRRR